MANNSGNPNQPTGQPTPPTATQPVAPTVQIPTVNTSPSMEWKGSLTPSDRTVKS